MPTKKRVFICRGKDCSKRNKQAQALCEALKDHAELCQVDCQKICKGPVLGVEINGRIEWFARIASDKIRRSAAHLLDSGELSRPLKRRRVRKRRGKFRGATHPPA